MKKRKKALSPVISTVLLIMIVIIIAIIIIIWANSFVHEVALKEIAGETKSVDQFCSEVSITPIVNDDGSFGFRNIGNVPIYAFKLRLVKKGTGSSDVIKEEGNSGLVNPGYSILIKGVEQYDNYEEIAVTPILLGKTSSGYQEYPCPETSSFKL